LEPCSFRRQRPDVRLSFPMMVSTTNDITGFKIARHLGIVRGITVRSRSVVGNIVGGLQSIFGGQIGAYLELAETARQEAFDHMCSHAAQAGANAVVGMRYDANEIMDGITEVLAYGTAVWVEPLAG
ncbi:MAG: YbjQ family protein, partial [Sphingomicrobium sp.]